MKARTVKAAFFSLLLPLLGASAANAETNSFRIAVIGDSVMWGQGLHDLQKVSTKVRQHLQNNLGGRAVSLQLLAHSGAVIGPADSQQEWEAAAAGMNGELPRDLPSISYQAAHQVVDPTGIDLVIMNGGINDVKVERIMNMFLGMDSVLSDIRDMGRQMTDLLNYVVPRFENATIVVTNYYPVISDDSHPTLAAGIFSYTLGDQADGWDTTFGPVLTSRWRQFHEQSTVAIREAVNQANAMNDTQRVRFVDSGFGAANAVGASDSWLYGAGEIDPVDYWREAICDAYDRSLFCYRANTGHPNRFGAELGYTAAILREISPLIPGWRATNTPNTLALRVVTNSMSGSSISITVHATDAISGAPRSGTVSINGVSGHTGSRINYRRCLATEDGKVPYAPCPGLVSVDGYEEAAFER